MPKTNSRHAWQRLTLLFPMLAMGALFGAASVAAQGFPNLPSSLDQVPGPAAKRAPATNNPSLTVVPEDFAHVRLASGYLLQLEVYNVPEMTATLRVDEQGSVSVPLIGPVHVAGETSAEAQMTIAKALVDADMLKSPQVTLNILQYAANNASVLGEVQFPGRVQLLEPKKLADVLALAGGETEAAGNDVEIQHTVQGIVTSTHIHYPPGSSPDLIQDAVVSPGDTVFIRRAGVVYVLGAVNRPGGFLMANHDTMNVLEAISFAFGMTQVAAPKELRIIRPEKDGSFLTLDVPFSSISKGKEKPTQMQAGDILYVPTSTVKSVLINGSGIISTAASAAIYKAP